MKRLSKKCWCSLLLLLCSPVAALAAPNTNSPDGSIVIIPTFSTGEDKLRMYWARPGETNFYPLSPNAVYSGSGTHTVRDPVLWRTNGFYYIACTADGFRQNNGGFDILQSSNLLDWTLVKTVPINASQSITWSPIRVIDKDGVEWFMCSVRTNPASGTTQRIYITRPVGTNYSGAWQPATRVTFAPDYTNNQIAEACVYNAGQYWLLVKDDTKGHKVNDWFVSPSLTSGYAPGPSGSTNLFQYFEGGGLIPLGNNDWEQIWDDYGPAGGLKVSFSSGGFTNWTALVPIGNTKNPLRLSNPAGPFVEPASAVQQTLDGRAQFNPSLAGEPVASDRIMSQQDYLAELDKLNVLWKNDQIDYVAIVHVQSSSRFAIEFNASHLDLDGPFRLWVRYPAHQNLTTELPYRLQKLAISGPAGDPALRWGIIFFNSKKERVFSVYLGIDGVDGVINDSPVKFSSDGLYSFLESTLGNVLN